MQSPDSQIIVLRFFEALSRLKTDKVIRGTKSFTDRYDINRRNLHTLSADPTRDIFQPSWLTDSQNTKTSNSQANKKYNFVTN